MLRRSVVRAEIGARIEEHTVIERSRVTAGAAGIRAAGDDIAINDSLLILGGSVGTVLRAEPDMGWDTNVTADGLTIYASPKLPDTVGVAVSTAPDPARSVHLVLRNSICPRLHSALCGRGRWWEGHNLRVLLGLRPGRK